MLANGDSIDALLKAYQSMNELTFGLSGLRSVLAEEQVTPVAESAPSQ